MIALYRGVSFTSRLIRFFNWSDYSHASWIDMNLAEYEAWQNGGVQVVGHWGANHTPGTLVDMLHIYLTKGEEQGLQEFFISQAGKKYDLAGVLGFVFRNDKIQKRNKWFCSELVSAGFKAIKKPLLSRIPDHKVSPAMLCYSPLLKECGQMIVQARKESDHEENPILINRFRDLGAM